MSFELKFEGNLLNIAKQESGEYGIENLKSLIVFVIHTKEELMKKLADGKLSFWEFLGLLDNAQDLVEVVSSFQACVKELMNLSEQELNELLNLIIKDLPNGADIEKAKEVLAWAIDVLAVVSKSITLFNKAKTLF